MDKPKLICNNFNQDTIMRFIKAYIDGYGKFHNRDFVFEPEFNLFLGPNEAGKTTVMSFLRAIFFGFPGKKSAVDRYEPLAGGIHGGRLELETTDKKILSVSLKPGRKLTGEIVILNGDGTELSGEGAKKSIQLFLHGISENIFKTVFAFSLTELQRLESLENDEINAHIYSAGTGIGDVILPDILKAVEEKRNRIYKHGGTAQIVPKITKELERVRAEISDIKKDRDRYKSTVIEIETLESEQTTLSKALGQKRRAKEKASRLKAGRDNVNELAEIEKQLASQPVIVKDFPTDGAARLNSLEEKLRERREEHQECRNQINNLRTQVVSICPDNKIIETEPLIIFLIEDRSAEVENIKRMHEIETALSSLRTNVSNAITDINPEWNEHGVLSIDIGKETLQNIRVLTDSISVAGVNVEKAENYLRQERKNRDDYYREFQAFSRKLEKTRPVIPLRLLLFFGLPIVLLAGAFCWMTFEPLSGIMAGILGVLSITAIYYVYNKSSRNTLEESRAQLKDMLETRNNSIEEAEKALSDARDKHLQTLAKWQEWLRDKGFSVELDRNGIFSLIESIRKIKDIIRKKEETERELRDVRERAVSYLDRANNALALCNLEMASLDTISPAIHKLNETLKRHKGLKEKREGLEIRAGELETRAKTVQDAADDLIKTIQSLIAEGGARNSEDFRKFSNVAQKRESLLERKNTLEIQLARLIGGAPEIKRFKDEVASETDPMETDRSIEVLGDEIIQLESKSSGIMQELGAKKNQISVLERNERLGELRLEEETLKVRLRGALSEWSISALCHELLNKAVTIYERERQPFVLKHAGRYLDRITEGRYIHVIRKTDDNKVVVETPEGLQKDVSALSRGTAEQLYLSMRLAFIKEYAERVGSLPLIVDDILVNFDPQRAKTTIRLLNEISHENQIIMFTCHPGTLDLCEKEIDSFKGPVMINI